MSDQKEFPSDKADKFVVRFPDGMRDRIKVAAESSGRSMNAEIIARIDQSLEQDIKIKDLIEAITSLSKAYDRQEKLNEAQQNLIKQLAKILRIVIDLIEPNSSGLKQTLEHYNHFAEALEDGDISKAIPHIEQVIKKGIESGIIKALEKK